MILRKLLESLMLLIWATLLWMPFHWISASLTGRLLSLLEWPVGVLISDALCYCCVALVKHRNVVRLERGVRLCQTERKAIYRTTMYLMIHIVLDYLGTKRPPTTWYRPEKKSEHIFYHTYRSDQRHELRSTGADKLISISGLICSAEGAPSTGHPEGTSIDTIGFP